MLACQFSTVSASFCGEHSFTGFGGRPYCEACISEIFSAFFRIELSRQEDFRSTSPQSRRNRLNFRIDRCLASGSPKVT